MAANAPAQPPVHPAVAPSIAMKPSAASLSDEDQVGISGIRSRYRRSRRRHRRRLRRDVRGSQEEGEDGQQQDLVHRTISLILNAFAPSLRDAGLWLRVNAFMSGPLLRS
jgi:hypothetical protein